ncbi:type I restriction endonuclease subunit R [Roseomonas alkaliterrae]|uniref:type I restriction endonuclease subunit R n=1 Tax=Neoroseomonas alkaliterrae TaxID=1452450 RepID=UPI001BA58404|nr:type I restriction endonuclease [Neoroseomonas alkaliterrae]MBR0676263.1 type I restriction endonuclease subunit R [Neoroseomonas alkaliterrae]
MTDLHREARLEEAICTHLAAHGWLYDPGAAARHDRARGLFPEDLLAWVQQTQPEAWEALTKAHGPAAATALADRLRAALDRQGTLDVLRHGLDMVGLRRPIQLAQFRPALAMNEALAARYAGNRLRVVRQLRYSPQHENSLDLVLFLNGIPVATAELKSDYTQRVEDAVDQYRFDRLPRLPGRNTAEPILAFPGGALVHFAVSNSEVRMCTRLEGPDSRFLPFNRGHDGGGGNPPNPRGAPTAYLWEEVWERHSWLDILGRYLVPVKDEKKRLQGWIFPRFHQLDATRKLLAAVLREGPGGRYLIQHSAGSGKTNSIAWTAHFLADLHDAADRKLFDTVLVVSDRTVLDRQLREAVEGFERTQGVVATITGEGASKSRELAEALAAGKKIVVCTIQTFPFAIEEVRRLAATQGKRFAVIADEAHSSQTGQAAAKLKATLSAEEVAALEDGGEVDMEDLLAAEMRARAAQDAGISYIAFTATPKAKTLELFGRRPDPSRPAAKDNLPAPFHVYSMRQAIEEGFILDVLRNYTSYRMAFRLTHEGRELDEQEVDASEARKGILGWVRLHPHNIAARVRIVVEHFRQNVAHLLGGHAKAMVVTASRKEAVRWMKAMEAYIRQRRYPIGVLVAFSGEVSDPETGPEPFTEANMNLGLRGRDIREAFATDEYSLLLVANKFQTGFDQPLLCAMYVDKRLAGIQAVQTLSRLNRAHPGKDTTYVVDFVNEPEEILAAFRQYHETAALADVSDPHVVLDLRSKLEAMGLFDRFEVERVAKVAVDPKATMADLDAAISPVSGRLLTRFREAQQAARAGTDGSRAREAAKAEMEVLLLFKRDLGSYVRLYEFLGQMFDYGNTDFEKLYLFGKLLLPLLDYGREREGVDLSALRLTHHRMRDLGQQRLNLGGGEPAEGLKPPTDVGSGQVQDRQKQRLGEIIRALNDLFEGELTEGDRVAFAETLRSKMMESATLRAQAAANSREQFGNSPNLREELQNAIIAAMEAHGSMSRQALNSEAIQAGLLAVLLGPGELWEGLRKGEGPGAGAAAR